jgi:hypothetical protein
MQRARRRSPRSPLATARREEIQEQSHPGEEREGLASPAGGRRLDEEVVVDADLVTVLEGGSDEAPKKAGVKPGGMDGGRGGGCRAAEVGLGRPPEREGGGGGGARPRRRSASL